MRLRGHQVLWTVYVLAAAALLLVSNRHSAVNEIWIGLVAVTLVAASLVARRSVRAGGVTAVVLEAVPFGYASLLGVLGAVITLERGGPFTTPIVFFALAGALAMATIAGYLLRRAWQVWAWTR